MAIKLSDPRTFRSVVTVVAVVIAPFFVVIIIATWSSGRGGRSSAEPLGTWSGGRGGRGGLVVEVVEVSNPGDVILMPLDGRGVMSGWY